SLLSATAFDLVAHIGDEPSLILFPHLSLALGIGAAVTDDLVPTRLDLGQDIRGVIEERGVDEMRGRQAELIEKIEDAPHADAVAIIAPGEGARVRRRQLGGHGMAKASPKGEMLDVETDIDGELLALRPAVARTIPDRGVGIAVVIWETHGLLSVGGWLRD